MMKRPCTCDRYDPVGPYTAGSCRLCYLFHRDPAYNSIWGGSGVVAAKPRCRHLGAPTGQTVDCPRCPSGGPGPAVPLLACSLYGTTTGRRGAPGERSCHACPGYDPDTFSLIAPLGTRGALLAWEGRSTQKPWHHKVTAMVPHLDTVEPLRLVLEILRLQTVRPYLLVVDTGSPPDVLRELESLRAEDCEIHHVRAHGYLHSSAPVTVALDLAFALCRSEYLYLTHADVFLRRRDYLAWLLERCNAKIPAVGYEMSPRDWATDQWQGMMSHTASMVHMPSMRRLGVVWNMEYAYELAGWQGKDAGGWPDTETGFNLILRQKGIQPHIIGPERNYELHRDENLIHVRSYPGTHVYSPENPYHQQAAAWMTEVSTEVKAQLAQWRRES